MNRSFTLNGKPIPPCMIGTWAWGKGYNGSKMIFGKTYSEAQLMETFMTASRLGFTLWDTAEVYGMGNAEKILGKCIAENEDTMISTKHMPGKKYKTGENENAITGSLHRMDIEKIDLYWLHKPYALQENMHELAKIMQEGTIKSIGLSNCNIAQLKKAKHFLEQNGCQLSAVQNHFSLLSMDRQMDIVKYCNENNILYFGYMVLEQGALSGKYDKKNPFPLFSMRNLSFGRRKFAKIQELITYEKALAKKYHVDVSQIPIAWAISKQVIPIVGLTKPEHARALSAGVKVTLLPAEIERLESLARKSGVKCKGSWE